MPAQLDPDVETTADLPTDEALVIVRDLEKSYGSVHAVRGVSFDLKRGEA